MGKPTATGAHASTDRRTRRREATREKLVDAARGLFAAKGVERTRINEITEAADVGFGSFYNHFADKEAIVEVVLSQTVASQGAVVASITRDVADPAEVMAIAHRHFVRQAGRDPDWAWLLIRLDLSHDIVLGALGPFARRDLKRGLEAGRFEVADERVALHAIGGALLGVMRAVLDDRAPRRSDVVHAEGVLRLLGLSVEDAAEVAARPIPTSVGASDA